VLEDRGQRLRGRVWLRAHLQACLDGQVEVVMAKGEPIYGRLIAFDLESRPPIIIVEAKDGRHFINLERVERMRFAAERGDSIGDKLAR